MKNKLLSLLLVAFLPLIALAESGDQPGESGGNGTPVLGYRNENFATIADTEGDNSKLATNRYGQLMCSVTSPTGYQSAVVPTSNSAGLNGTLDSVNGYWNVGTDTIEALSTTTVLVLTAHAARVGDLIMPTGGTAANVNVAIPVCSVATNSVTLCYPLPATPSTDAIVIRRPQPLFAPAEDDAHTSGEKGLFVMASIRNANESTIAGTEGDYMPIGVDAAGRMIISNAAGLAGIEDVAFGNGNAGIVGMSAREDTISVDANADTDRQPLKSDKFGRLLTAPYPDAHLFTCNSASDITDTNSTAVCAADADEIYNVTAICCSNTDATVATRVDILDGSTVMWQLEVGSGVTASENACVTFAMAPLKMAAINTAINARCATNSAQVRCSINGFKTPS